MQGEREHPTEVDMADTGLFERYQLERLPIYTAPFGLDEKGNKIDHVTGSAIKASVELMMDIISQKTDRALPPEASRSERQEQTEAAVQTALNDLVAILNASFQDQRFYVDADYLLNGHNYYSYEFNVVVQEYAKAMCGDENFYYRRGTRSIPGSVTWLVRPLSIGQVYEIVPRLVAKFTRTDIRVLTVDGSRAVIQWWPQREMSHVPECYHQAYYEGGAAYKGLFAAIPQAKAGLPLASVHERLSPLQGDPCFEWEFFWTPQTVSYVRYAWLGLVGSLVLLGYVLWSLPGHGWIVPLVPLPLVVGMYTGRLRRVQHAAARHREQLLDQQTLSEMQLDQLQAAYTDLQSAHIDLEHRLGELTVLHEVGLTVASVLNLDALLDQVLHVVRKLYFDRAMIMLVDEAQGALVCRRAVGGMPDLVAFAEQLQIPLDKEDWAVVRALNAGEPVLMSVENVQPEAAAMAQMLQTSDFLIVPLQAKGEAVGVLIVDNAHTQRPISQADQEVLLTLGRTVAVAIENVRWYQTLEQKVAERTRQLQAINQALAREKEAAEEANRAKSLFLATVSHELRTPLTSVLGFAKVIEKRLQEFVFPAVVNEDGKVERAIRQVKANLDIIVTEGERLAALINHVLDLAKIEAGKAKWNMTTVLVEDLVERSVEVTGSLFVDKPLDLMVDVQAGLPNVKGDYGRLIQVMANLISNAVKFTQEGSVVCRARWEGDEQIVVSVTDTGVGIDPANHKKVFEKFFQIDDILTDKPQGTGLGLSICKNIVEHHGGRIWVDSTPGQGSTFSFSLPVFKAEPSESVIEDG